MNCPKCKHSVGIDNHHIGEWKPVKDDLDIVIGLERTISVRCEYCGLFEAIQVHDYRITKIDGPVTDPKRMRAIESRIPGCQFPAEVPV